MVLVAFFWWIVIDLHYFVAVAEWMTFWSIFNFVTRWLVLSLLLPLLLHVFFYPSDYELGMLSVSPFKHDILVPALVRTRLAWRIRNDQLHAPKCLHSSPSFWKFAGLLFIILQIVFPTFPCVLVMRLGPFRFLLFWLSCWNTCDVLLKSQD